MSEHETPLSVIRKPHNLQNLDDMFTTLKHAIKFGASAKAIVMCVDGWAEAEEAAKKIAVMGYKLLLVAMSAVIYVV